MELGLRRTTLALGLLSWLFGLSACGASQATSPKPPAPAKAASEQSSDAAAAAALPPGSVSRAKLDSVLEQGPSWVLAHVQVEEVIRKGEFVGWKVVDMPADWTVDIQRGDVVKSVNGMPVERPGQLWEAWTGLANADEVKIRFERDGSEADLVLPVVGKSTGAVAEKLEKRPPPPPPKPNGGVQKTIVIGGQ